MKIIILLMGLLTSTGCKNETATDKLTKDDVDDFIENVFGEDKGKPLDCDALISNVDFSNLCIANQSNFITNKDLENALICIYILKSNNSTVDIAINSSPMSILTGQVFKAAKANAEKKGTVKKIRRLGKDAFYHEYKFASGDYATQNRDLIFYEGKTMFTLHTVGSIKSKDNCMSNESQLKKLANALQESAKKYLHAE